MSQTKSVRRSARHAGGEAAFGSIISEITPATSTAPADSTASPSQPLAPAKRGTYFRFLDLPAEIRNRTYAFALLSDHTQARSLSDLKFPSITQVNQQLRQESLAFLFAESSFFLYVGSNFRARANARQKTKVRKFPTTDYNSTSGTLGYKRVVQKFPKSAGDSAILRDVTFMVYDSSHIEDVRNANRSDTGMTHYQQRIRDNQCAGTLRLIFDHILTTSIDVLNHRFLEMSREDTETALAEAAQFASTIAGRPQFKGFTLSDLNKIARAFGTNRARCERDDAA